MLFHPGDSCRSPRGRKPFHLSLDKAEVELAKWPEYAGLVLLDGATARLGAVVGALDHLVQGVDSAACHSSLEGGSSY